MKISILTFALVLCGSFAVAQNPYLSVQGATEGEDGVSVTLPRSVIAVNVSVERDVTLCGPYARYAQKFLGVRAPLTDKTTWSVKRATVGLVDKSAFGIGDASPSKSEVMQYATSDDEFSRLPADKNAMTVPALEDAARETATQIFALRKHRIELVTGEAGENVFGEGLEAALEEISRLEQSYLELFLGKRILTTVTKQYVVFAQENKKQYVVCRFSADNGLMPATDLSGEMVVLQIEPSGNTSVEIEASPKEQYFVTCRVADPSTCTVICGGQTIGAAVLPLYEFGRTIRVAAPRRK